MHEVVVYRALISQEELAGRNPPWLNYRMRDRAKVLSNSEVQDLAREVDPSASANESECGEEEFSTVRTPDGEMMRAALRDKGLYSYIAPGAGHLNLSPFGLMER